MVMNVSDYIIKHEGKKLKPYLCPANVWTLGVGHALTNPLPDDIKAYLDANGEITDEMTDRLLAIDIQIARKDCETLFPYFDNFSDNRQMALIDIAFNLGYNRFKGFKKAVYAINTDNWDVAADELTNSKWYVQVKNRSVEDVRLILDG
jgi:lysozyme